MEFILVIESFAYGSAKSVKQLGMILKAQGSVTVFYARRDGTELELVDLDPEIKWIEMPGYGPYKHFKNILFLRSLLNDKVKVIHGHSTFGGVYIKFASVFNHSISKTLKRYYSPRGYAFMREDLPIIVRKIIYLFEKFTSIMATTIACGPSEEKIASSFFGRLTKINNSLNVPEGDVKYSNKGPVLTVGRICHQKGFDIVLDIARHMPERNFVWIGSCEPQDKYLLDSMPKNIEIISYMEHKKLLKQIHSCAVMLLPSRWEGLSRVLLESLVIGRPIVTSAIPANIDCLDFFIDSYKNGFSCANLKEYADAIETILSDKEKSLIMANASREYALSEFEYKKVKAQWLDLYLS
ncbi:MAG: glycosyltransferase [Oceanospirillaceae bacterium]|nr:glycosyltransferase [Oceanospirillaceae bacterium]